MIPFIWCSKTGKTKENSGFLAGQRLLGRHTRELSGEIKMFYTMLSVWATRKFFKCTLSSVQTSSPNITESLHSGKNHHWQKNGWTQVNLRDNITNSHWKAKQAENADYCPNNPHRSNKNLMVLMLTNKTSRGKGRVKEISLFCWCLHSKVTCY